MISLIAQEEPAELSQARAVYERDVEFATRPIRDRYLSRLDSLKRALGSKGDARAALAVQEEMERVKGIGGGMEKFAGNWSIKYANGATRTYSITADGTLTEIAENGAKIAPKSAKITLKGTDFIVEVDGGSKIERLTLSGSKLMIDHFNPKTTYPAGAPALRAIGTRAADPKP